MPLLTIMQQQHQTQLTMMQENNRAVLAQMEERIKAAEARAAAAVAPAPAAATSVERPKSPAQQFKELLEMANAISDMRDGGKSGGGMPGWAAIVEPALRAVETVSGNVASIVYNTQLAKGLAAMAPPDAAGADEEGDEDEATPGQLPPAAAAPAQSEQEMLMQFLADLEKPLLQSLAAGQSGTQFAAEMMLAQGNEGTYDWLVSQGKDRIRMFLQMRQSLWQALLKRGPQFETFLDQFLQADAAKATLRQLMAARTMPVPMQATPAQTPAAAPVVIQGTATVVPDSPSSPGRGMPAAATPARSRPRSQPPQPDKPVTQ
jgi:hypothetical protein